ncbi:MAG: histidinol-phosphatase [Planctomycetia bacterium]|nr:histidinol-phosphatase [Planctomycetia bacterium]
MSSEQISNRLEKAVRFARVAGRHTLEYFQRDNYQIETKQDATPVTIADKSTEALLRRFIEEAFPNDAILGEELPTREGESGFRWILDPIDGTKSFVHGVPLYGTLVAVEFEGKAVVGVIYIPALDECVYAMKGGGAWYVRGEGGVPQRARVSNCATLRDALVLTTDEKTFHETQRETSWARLLQSAKLTRTWGDCYGYLLVATGRADCMIDPEMSVWDSAALQPVIEEAGGVFSGWNGAREFSTGDAIATNPALYPEVRSHLNQN